jgi:hypothetical protein
MILGATPSPLLVSQLRRCSQAHGVDLFKERLIYEQLAARTLREQQENRTCGWSRQPLKIEQLH